MVWARVYVHLALLAASLGWLSLGRSLAFQLLVNAALLSLAVVQLGFLGHDASHRQLLRSAHGSRRLGFLLWNVLCGISMSWWEDKHRRHHRHPHVLDQDPDLYAVFSFDPEALAGRPAWRRWAARYQAWLFLPLVACTAAYFQALSLLHVVRARPAGWRAELAALVLRHAVLFGLALHALGPAGAAAFLSVHYVLAGLYLGAVFSCNHYGLPVLPPGSDLPEPDRTLRVTRNVRTGRLGDYLFGGLNYQIEHHLQPGLPRHALRAAAARTREWCRAGGRTYHETGWRDAMRAVFTQLHAAGRPTGPAPRRHHAAP
ncbi:MAG: fatty acid desaturase family protein [Ramlibacter sp.]